jgi:hypothetical protein
VLTQPQAGAWIWREISTEARKFIASHLARLPMAKLAWRREVVETSRHKGSYKSERTKELNTGRSMTQTIGLLVLSSVALWLRAHLSSVPNRQPDVRPSANDLARFSLCVLMWFAFQSIRLRSLCF